MIAGSHCARRRDLVSEHLQQRERAQADGDDVGRERAQLELRPEHDEHERDEAAHGDDVVRRLALVLAHVGEHEAVQSHDQKHGVRAEAVDQDPGHHGDGHREQGPQQRDARLAGTQRQDLLGARQGERDEQARPDVVLVVPPAERQHQLAADHGEEADHAELEHEVREHGLTQTPFLEPGVGRDAVEDEHEAEVMEREGSAVMHALDPGREAEDEVERDRVDSAALRSQRGQHLIEQARRVSLPFGVGRVERLLHPAGEQARREQRRRRGKPGPGRRPVRLAEIDEPDRHGEQQAAGEGFQIRGRLARRARRQGQRRPSRAQPTANRMW